MNWKRLVVALLLLAPLGTPAAAAEPPEHQSKNARKLLAALDAMGVNDPLVKDFVNNVDAHVKDGYIPLAEHKMEDATLRLQYTLGNGINIKQVELKFKPENSNWEATARTDGIRVNYKIKF